MKKLLKKLILTLLLAAPMASGAQTTVVVADGTANSLSVPMRPFNAPYAQRSQSIYPASYLTSLVGDTISAITYYTGDLTFTPNIGTWTIKLAVTSQSNLQYGWDLTATTTVFNGTPSYANGELTYTFDSFFVYNGGNLLVYFDHQAQTGTTQNSFSVRAAVLDNASRFAINSAYSSAYNGDGSVAAYLPTLKVTLASVGSGSGGSSDPETTPQCDTILLDGNNAFSENFDTMTTTGNAIVPSCWSTSHILGSASQVWGAYSASTSSTHSGSRMMQYPDMQQGNSAILVSPAFSIAAPNQYQVSLWVKRTSSYSNKANEGVKVWASTTPDTVGGTLLFHARRSTTQPPAVSSDGWYEYTATIPLDGVVYIVMQGISEYGAATFVDDFSVMRTPSCSDPDSMVFDAATGTVSWAPGNATMWQVRDGNLLTVVNTPNYANPQWDYSTQYTIDVRSICGDGDTNAWRQSITFTTPRVACLDTTPLPYSTNFGGYDYTQAPYYANAPLPDCWSVVSNGTNTPDPTSSASVYYSGIGQATSINNYGCVTPNDPYFAFIAYAPYIGTYTTYVNNMNAYGTRKYAILPRFELPVRQLQLCFDYSMSSRNGAELHVGYIVSDTSDFTSLYVVPNAYRTRTSSGNIDFATLASDIPADARIAMLWLTTDTVTTGSAPANHFCGIDNLTVSVAPSCKYPRNLTVDSIGFHGVQISWNEVSSTPASQWEILYGPQGFDTATDGTSLTVSTTAAAIGGLTADSYYDFYVRALCSASQYSNWSAPATVHTPCPNGGNVILGTEQNANYTISFGNYGNTMAQTVFTAQELTAAGLHAADTVDHITFDWVLGNTVLDKQFSIWVGHTAVEEFPDVASASDWIDIATQTLVYDALITAADSGATRYNFTTPFVWNGTNAIVVSTMLNQPAGSDHNNSGRSVASSDAGARRTLYARTDHNAYSAASFSTVAPGSTNYRANMLIDRPCIDVPDDTLPVITFCDTLILHDTIFFPQTDTLFVPQTDTVFVTQTDTIFIPQMDTVFVPQTDTIFIPQIDTVYIPQTDTIFIPQIDTVYITVHDTIYISTEAVDGPDTAPVKVYGAQGIIVVEDAPLGEAIRIYDVNGRLLQFSAATSTRCQFNVPATGAYMVKVGNHTAVKVVAKR